MLKNYGLSFGTVYAVLMDAENKLADADPASEMPENRQLTLRWEINTLVALCKELGMGGTQARAERLLFSLHPTYRPNSGFPAPTSRFLCTEVHELRVTMADELQKRLFLFVPTDRVDWYDDDDKPMFGDEVARAFPDTTAEIAEFGRCFAVGQWTASVFHMMRATEVVLHKWCGDLGAPLRVPAEQANWEQIIKSAATHLKQIENQPRSKQRDADLEYFGSSLVSSLVSFMGIKDAWRNHVSHTKATYDERKATSIMHHVRAFMERLSSRP
jgi:hypothetical protein